MRARFLVLSFFLLLIANLAVAQCVPTGGDPSVTICSPASGDTAGYLHIAAAATSSSSVDLMQVYLNGHKRWEKAVSVFDIKLQGWAQGPYHVTVQAHDTSGRWFQSSVDMTVSGGASTCDTNQPARSVVFCIPIDGEVIWTPYPIRVWYTPASSSQPVKVSQLYLDGVQIWENQYPYWPYSPPANPVADQALPLGLHRLTIQGIDAQGAFKNSIWVRIASVNRGCPLPAAQPAVEICNLTDGATVTSPVHLQAAANAKKGVWVMQVYVDRQKVYEDGHTYLDMGLTMTPGTHRLTVQARSGDLVWFSQTINITVQ